MEPPTFQCQSCAAPLHITGFETLQQHAQQQQQQQQQQQEQQELESQRQNSTAAPPPPFTSAPQASSPPALERQPGAHSAPHGTASGTCSSTSAIRMDESFVNVDPSRLAAQEAALAGVSPSPSSLSHHVV